jgi:hypothetical protein
MEPKDTLIDIRQILDGIIEILSCVGEINWLNAMRAFRNRSEPAGTDERRQLLSDIMRIYGGMGSFSDLVLYKEGKLVPDENSRLDELRRRLFNAALNGRT